MEQELSSGRLFKRLQLLGEIEVDDSSSIEFAQPAMKT